MDQIITISSDSSTPPSPEHSDDVYDRNYSKSSTVKSEINITTERILENFVKMSQDSGFNTESPKSKQEFKITNLGYDSDTMELDCDKELPHDVQHEILPSLKKTVHSTFDDNENNRDDLLMIEEPLASFSQTIKQIQNLALPVYNTKDDGKKKRKGTVDKSEMLEEKLRKQAEKEMKKAEREKKKAEEALDKAMRKAAAASSRLKKPGECLKTIKVLVDSSLIHEKFGGALLSALEEIGVERNVQDQLIQSTVTWTRQVINHNINEDDRKLELITNYSEENYILLIWTWDTIITQIKSDVFIGSILSVMSCHPGKKMTLLIYDPQNISRGKKSLKKGSGNSHPQVCEDVILDTLVELQLRHSCQYYLVHSAEELGTAVAQFTKAIALKPFKLEKQEEQFEEADWFAAGDSNDCVKVDKNGNGLLQLWRQQLCQFPLATLATAEAISAVYPSPCSLVEAYKCCSSEKEGLLLLQDIKVRRGAGPLATVQRIGPELSKKIFKFFNSENGDELL